MANYKLGPVIGKIGGGDVEVIPVNIVADGSSGSVAAHTITVPDGETWLVGIFGQVDPGSLFASSQPRLVIGDLFESATLTESPSRVNFFWLVPGPTTVGVGLLRRMGTEQDVLSGHIYTVPLP